MNVISTANAPSAIGPYSQGYEANNFISKPSRSCVAVKELPKGVLCEIEAIAVK